MQVIMARGLAAKWKQPIFVDFDTKMTAQILYSAINSLHSIGYHVVACVGDLGGGNQALINELHVTPESPTFSVPGIANSVVYFPDAPHLLKLIRNWLLDGGFILPNGNKIIKDPLEKLVDLTSTEINVCHKLTEAHVTCKGFQRQKVHLATQLLSHTTSTALLHYKDTGKLGDDVETITSTANFIELMDQWFDLVNVRVPSNSEYLPYKTPYGKYLNEQNALLSTVSETIGTMKSLKVNKKGQEQGFKQVFQKGVQMHTCALKLLYNNVYNLGVKYILTHKVNQDALENLFSQLRTRGGNNDHPSPLQAIHHLRMIILGKNPGTLNTNTRNENMEEYIFASAITRPSDSNEEIPDEFEEWNPALLEEEEIGNIETEVSEFRMEEESHMEVHDEEEKQLEKVEQMKLHSLKDTTYDGFIYLTGWIAKKFKKLHPNLGKFTKDVVPSEHAYSVPVEPWVQHLSHGGLIQPATQFVEIAWQMELMFNELCSDGFLKGPKIIERLTESIRRKVEKINMNFPTQVIKAFVKQRIFIRIKYKNHISKENAEKRAAKNKLKRLSKLKKTTT